MIKHGMRNPSDYGLRSPMSECDSGQSDHEERRIQEGWSDEEVLIHRYKGQMRKFWYTDARSYVMQ